MTTPRRPSFADWRAGLAAGTLLGILFLGAGGRLGMRLIAFSLGQTPIFTLDGSVAVVLLGAATGALVGALFLLSRALFPTRRFLRAASFWTVVSALVLRGLHPVTPVSAAIFLPLFAAHGALLHVYWCRIRSRVSSVPSP